MKHYKWQILLGVFLVMLSVSLYFVHYLIFRDAHHIFIYLVGDIAFLPVEVLIVTMIIHKLLEEREKKAKLEKLNVVIETFFSKMGTTLLSFFSDFDPALDKIRKDLIVTNDWSDLEFAEVSKRMKNYEYTVLIEKIDLNGLRVFLLDKRDFLLRMLENPVMLEHESFTELLRAVFHLTEELANRENPTDLPSTDLQHLSGDIKRAYAHLAHQWLDYMKYLKNNYPYLFSLAMRTNPFDREASPIVK